MGRVHLQKQSEDSREWFLETVGRVGNRKRAAREDGSDMNPYAILGSGVGTEEAASLCVRLNAWHDAMVAHERRLRAGSTAHRCDEDCPHIEARTLWAEALATFGKRASDLAFLRSRAMVSSVSDGPALEVRP
jgi:hypothetical protein